MPFWMGSVYFLYLVILKGPEEKQFFLLFTHDTFTAHLPMTDVFCIIMQLDSLKK